MAQDDDATRQYESASTPTGSSMSADASVDASPSADKPATPTGLDAALIEAARISGKERNLLLRAEAEFERFLGDARYAAMPEIAALTRQRLTADRRTARSAQPRDAQLLPAPAPASAGRRVRLYPLQAPLTSQLVARATRAGLRSDRSHGLAQDRDIGPTSHASRRPAVA